MRTAYAHPFDRIDLDPLHDLHRTLEAQRALAFRRLQVIEEQLELAEQELDLLAARAETVGRQTQAAPPIDEKAPPAGAVYAAPARCAPIGAPACHYVPRPWSLPFAPHAHGVASSAPMVPCAHVATVQPAPSSYTSSRRVPLATAWARPFVSHVSAQLPALLTSIFEENASGNEDGWIRALVKTVAPRLPRVADESRILQTIEARDLEIVARFLAGADDDRVAELAREVETQSRMDPAAFVRAAAQGAPMTSSAMPASPVSAPSVDGTTAEPAVNPDILAALQGALARAVANAGSAPMAAPVPAPSV